MCHTLRNCHHQLDMSQSVLYSVYMFKDTLDALIVVENLNVERKRAIEALGQYVCHAELSAEQRMCVLSLRDRLRDQAQLDVLRLVKFDAARAALSHLAHTLHALACSADRADKLLLLDQEAKLSDALRNVSEG